MVVYEAPPQTEDISEKYSGRVPELLEIEDASHRSQQMGDMSEGALPESLRTEENAPSDSLGEAVVAHREVCSRSRAELRQYEADIQRATKERKALKLLLGQRGKEIKDLRAELAKAHQDQTDMSEQVMTLLKAYGFDTGMMSNLLVSQLQQKIEMIGKLREEVDVIKAESLMWKEGMDLFATEKGVARAQLSLAKNQLQSIKEKSSVQARKTEELEARLASELANVEKTKADADAFVAIYRDNAEAA
ncbi:WEB family protein At1g12150-like [Nicotiana tomentosiformis]|uniref:WEB family protein At1g12150-like n=1 Tax=Nicotiana tomentosiformis TaxID=4098 RepID=UPI00388CAA4E